MNAGAFSDDKVIGAMQRIVPIIVDCSERGTHEELKAKYAVRGYPTALYVDPDGKQLREIGSREAGSLAKEIETMSAKYPGKPTIWQNSLKSAVAAAKKAKKPVALYAVGEDVDFVKLTLKLQKDLGDRKAKFLWVPQLGGRDGLDDGASVTLVLDPNADDPMEEPLATIEVKKDDKPDVLNKALDEAAKKLKK